MLTAQAWNTGTKKKRVKSSPTNGCSSTNSMMKGVIQDIESGPDNGHLCGPQPSCLSNHQSSIIKESNFLTKQNYSSRIITMDSPSMMTEVVEVYLRQIQAEQSCRPWSEVSFHSTQRSSWACGRFFTAL